MTSAILSSAGRSFSGSLIKSTGFNKIPFSGMVTGRIKSLTANAFGRFGSEIDEALFGADEINYIRGPRLLDLNVQSSSYGETIPIIFGRVKLSGNIIWARPIKEVVNTSVVSSGGKGGEGVRPVNRTETRYSYFATFAIAISEGEVTAIEKFFANESLINPSDFCTNYTIYKGAEIQEPDPLIESYEGIGKTPAYKGISYIVFEDFSLSEFNNRIPNFTFEVTRLQNSGLEQKIKSISLIPGSGEFVYDTEIKTKTYGYDLAGKWIETTNRDVVNMNNASNKSDIEVSLDRLAETLPNLEYVSVIINWFASSTDIANCIFEPKVEYKAGTQVIPSEWAVAGKTRTTASEISVDNDGNILYGGTPSDASVLNLITELKNRGYKIMIYPMPLVDVIGKPWRGYITGDSSEVSNFFSRTSGYNDFILYYANLTKNLVDSFIIGTEMRDLTSIKDGSGNYPAVTEFINLAASVKTIMGGSTKISYAADWSEYHSKGGEYYLDDLWMSNNIDFIGIDAYFPLADEPQDPNYDLQAAIDGWQSGEGYDWYYTDSERTTKANLSAPYAWKNIEYWWKNYHYNPDNTQTSWVPESKKIWFTEYGFPSVDGALNQPNVFYNPESVDGGMPRFSQGYTDFAAQRLGIEATENFWENSTMVENKFLWAYDARPYPYFPALQNVWSDGYLWSKGHWVNGKLGQALTADAIKEICAKCGLNKSEIDTSTCRSSLEGFAINNSSDAEEVLEYLQIAYGLDIFQSNNKILFQKKGLENIIEISEDDFVFARNFNKFEASISGNSKKPQKIELNYISKDEEFIISNSSFSLSDGEFTGNNTKMEISLPIILNDITAQKIAENILLEEQNSNSLIEFNIPKSKLEVEVGDVLKLPDNGQYKVLNLQEEDGYLEVTGVKYDNIYNIELSEDNGPSELNIIKNIEDAVFEILDIPTIEPDASNLPNLKFAISYIDSDYSGAEIFYKEASEAQFSSLIKTEKKAILGNVLSNFVSYTGNIDEDNEIEVQLISGTLNSISEAEFQANKNLCLMGDEIIAFRDAVLVSENRYRISHLKRGLFGTEAEIDNHSLAERFVLLDDNIVNISLPSSAIGQDYDIKIVRFGQNIDDVPAVNFTFNSINLYPLSPINLTATLEANNDVTFTFERRTRQNNYLVNSFTSLPLAEAEEKYSFEVYDNATQVREEILTSPNYIYTEANQIADFGSLQASYDVKIAQISDKIGKGKFLEETVTPA